MDLGCSHGGNVLPRFHIPSSKVGGAGVFKKFWIISQWVNQSTTHRASKKRILSFAILAIQSLPRGLQSTLFRVTLVGRNRHNENKQTDIATERLNRPRSWSSENLAKGVKLPLQVTWTRTQMTASTLHFPGQGGECIRGEYKGILL